MEIISKSYLSLFLSKGYLVYDSDILLKISTGTARTLYMLVEKLRFNNVFLELDCIFLIKRIPLKLEKRNMNRTIEILRHNFEELKKLNLIESFEIVKGKTWEASTVKIKFSEKAIEEKQTRFFEDKNEFRKMTTSLMISDTENYLVSTLQQNAENFGILKDVTPEEKVAPTKEMINSVINLMPSKAKTLKTMPKTISDAISEHGLQRVVNIAKYMKKNKVEKIRAYFLKALTEGWEIDHEEIPVITTKNKIEEAEVIEEEISVIDLERINSYLDNLTENKIVELEEIVYKDYIKKCGSETKIQKLAFKNGKKRIIEKYVFENIDFNKIEKEQIEEIKKETGAAIISAQELKDYILNSLNTYRTFFDFTEGEFKELHTNVFFKITPHFVTNTITLEMANKILEDELKEFQKTRKG